MLAMGAVCIAQTCCSVHRVLTLEEPQYLVDSLYYRQDGQLHFPRVRLQVRREYFSYFGLSLYNDIRCSLKSLKLNRSYKLAVVSFWVIWSQFWQLFKKHCCNIALASSCYTIINYKSCRKTTVMVTNRLTISRRFYIVNCNGINILGTIFHSIKNEMFH